MVEYTCFSPPLSTRRFNTYFRALLPWSGTADEPQSEAVPRPTGKIVLDVEDLTIDPWILEYHAYDPRQELLREALCTVGNGRFASRGAAPEHRAESGRHYPGTYLAGLYNRLTDETAGRQIENESMVNLPNWLFLTFRIDGGPWFSLADVEIHSYRQAL